MRRFLPLLVALLCLGMSLGSCTGAGPAEQPTQATAQEPTTGGAATETPPNSGLAGMDHGAMGSSDTPFDAQFINGMISHHEGAIRMAEQALEESERPEVRTLAEAIIAAQRPEIEQLQAWRAQWYADLEPTSSMSMEMGAMTISDDATLPFDQRFLTAMISHHEGAIAMARAAQAQAEHAELRQLAVTIIAAQEAEIQTMQGWLQAWFSAQ